MSISQFVSVLFTKERTFTLLLIGGLVLGVVASVAYHAAFAPPVFSAEAELAELRAEDEPVLIELSHKMTQLVADYGVSGVLEIIHLALRNEDIYMNDCHSLSHLLGHYAVSYYHYDFDAVLDQPIFFCARGYLHGAEAQLVLEEGSEGVLLHALCDALQRRSPGETCYHGAGHAYLADTLDIDETLAFCESLARGTPESDGSVVDCYEGAFSEVANLVGGFDGGTGRRLEGAPPLTIDVTPLQYCEQFPMPAQAECAFELNGLSIRRDDSPEKAGRAMRECIDGTDIEVITNACLYNTAAAYVRHEIEQSQQVTFQPWILEYPPRIREVYIVGAGQEVSQHILGGQSIDMEPFCTSFPTDYEVDLCRRQVVSSKLLAPVP